VPPASQEKRSAEVTRQRILDAALTRFARASYEEVRLRDVALDVGVDVALVHRAFGSKELLFTEAVRAALHSERLVAPEQGGLVGMLTRDIFGPDSYAGSRRADALHIFIHSLSSPQARGVLNGFVASDLIAPLATRLQDPAPQRAALALACVAGISILRDILHVGPLLDGARQESEPLIKDILCACLGAAENVTPAEGKPAPTARKLASAKAASAKAASVKAGSVKAGRAATLRARLPRRITLARDMGTSK